MKKLLIDCSVVYRVNQNTGIQRVVKSVIEQMEIICKDTAYSSFPVTLEDDDIKQVSLNGTKSSSIKLTKDDILLLVDSTWEMDIWDAILKAKSKEVTVIAIIHDIIPITHPQYFEKELVKKFNHWLNETIKYVDAFISVSSTTQKQLKNYIQNNYSDKIDEKIFDNFLLGTDFQNNKMDIPLKNIKPSLINLYNSHKSIYLIVSTLEPRKNHKYLLDVFDKLWEQDIDVVLNIVGKRGWKTDDLINRIKYHKYYNDKLFYWNNLSDKEVNYCYQHSKISLFPSFVEGFGLPIIESLSSSLPIIASDIPIHREIGGTNIGYFDILIPDNLVMKIIDIEKYGIPNSLKMKPYFGWIDWFKSTKILLSKIDKIDKDIIKDKKSLKSIKEEIKKRENIKTYSYSDFTQYDDIKFIENIFIKILKREIDKGAFNYYLKLLRSGEKTKHEILTSIRYTDEGRKNGVKLIGSLREYFIDSICKLPFVGKIFEWSISMFTLPIYLRKLNRDGNKTDYEIINLKNELLTLQTSIKNINFSKISHKENKKSRESIENQVRREISSQSILFHQRIEQFILQLESKITTSEDIRIVKDGIPSIISDDYYLAFENIFRGERKVILQRYQGYLKYLNTSIKTALDIGCGRGEWVEILQSNSIDAIGIDINFSMINEGINFKVKNLKQVDAFEFLKSCEDNTFNLITAFHIIEHIPYTQLFLLLQEIKRVSTPNAIILLETPNPANFLVSTYEFYKDLTHLNPLPSDVIKFMVEYIGFKEVEVDFLHPFPEEVYIKEDSESAFILNNYLYQAKDYLIIAKNAKKSKISTLPKLAYLSPIPPQRSGISNYSAELIPHLEKYYDIDIITESIKREKDYKIRTIEWFKNNYNEYDRIVYHFGNSNFHTYMINLLDEISGVVVLHDFYLSDLMLSAKILNQNFIYTQHGYRAVQDYEKIELSKFLNNYPCNKRILNNALSVITHSQYSKKLASNWYSQISMQEWSTIPLLRTPLKNEEKLISKKALNLPANAFVVSSFGQLSPYKMNQELLKAWIKSSLCNEQNCYLIFVGEDINSIYTKKLKESIENSLYSKRIIITNWVNMIEYRKYFSITDIAVQLRTHSRGETSGTVLDSMNYGIATIINANGSNQEIPKDSVYMLEDKFTRNELKLALESLYNNKQKRELLAKKSRNYILKNHSPKQCAKLYHQIIEETYQKKNKNIKASVNTLSKKIPDTKMLVETISLSNFDRIKQKQILIDISSIVQKDLKTGIQRVVRSQIIELIKNAPSNYRIEPIYLSEKDEIPTYYYARVYTTKFLNLKTNTLSDEPIKVNRNDIFYGLDLCLNEVSKSLELYKKYKALGIKITFLVYDLLPIIRPEFFPNNSKTIHTKWLETITEVADQIISISKSVENDVLSWVREHKNLKLKTIIFKTVHLGADIEEKNQYLCPEKTTTFLMVGTIEPRKGHDQVLKSFEILWKNGIDINLKIIGKKGWMMDNFIKKLLTHPKLNKNLFYLEFIDDKMLNTLYHSANCIIVASEAEGFGLPLIESALYNLPIIARDIPVFKEIAGDHAYYFKNSNNPKELSIAIEKWLLLYKQNLHPKSNTMPYLTWEDNAKKILNILSVCGEKNII